MLPGLRPRFPRQVNDQPLREDYENFLAAASKAMGEALMCE
jgi:hypothetical protein